MERISELLDDVGWIQQDDQREYNGKVFLWMTEATNRIQELQYQRDRLNEKIDALEQRLDNIERSQRDLAKLRNV